MTVTYISNNKNQQKKPILCSIGLAMCSKKRQVPVLIIVLPFYASRCWLRINCPLLGTCSRISLRSGFVLFDSDRWVIFNIGVSVPSWC